MAEWKIDTTFKKFLVVNCIVMALIQLISWMVLFGIFFIALILGVE